MTTARILLALVLVSGCSAVEPLSVIGDQCDVNSECEAPLICALGRCRKECEAQRDCALGLRCLKLPAPSTNGVCQLPDETGCERPSDCQEPLVCFMPAGCMLECVEDGDCAAGESCVSGECIQPEVPLCGYDSDCPYPQICEREACIRGCVSDIDCRREIGPTRVCVQHASCEGPCMCRLPCDLAAPDCPSGTECTPCDAGADCSSAADALGLAEAGYCERTDPDGTG